MAPVAGEGEVTGSGGGDLEEHIREAQATGISQPARRGAVGMRLLVSPGERTTAAALGNDPNIRE